MALKRHAFALEIKQLDEAGEFTGLAAVYANEDQNGDVIERGAFSRSLAERGNQIPILWQHNLAEPIGLGTLSDSDRGLLIEGTLDLDVALGKRAHSALTKGYLKGLSIGYDVVKQRFEAGVRRLTEVRVWETSVVTLPANPLALVSAVKQGGPIDLAALLEQAQWLSSAVEAAVAAERKAADALSPETVATVTSARDALQAAVEGLTGLMTTEDPNDTGTTDAAAVLELAGLLTTANDQMRASLARS